MSHEKYTPRTARSPTARSPTGPRRCASMSQYRLDVPVPLSGRRTHLELACSTGLELRDPHLFIPEQVCSRRDVAQVGWHLGEALTRFSVDDPSNAGGGDVCRRLRLESASADDAPRDPQPDQGLTLAHIGEKKCTSRLSADTASSPTTPCWAPDWFSHERRLNR